MKLKKWTALALSAALATCMLTGCPWEENEENSDDASSIPGTSQGGGENTGGSTGGGTEEGNPDSGEEEKPEQKPQQYNFTVSVNVPDGYEAPTRGFIQILNSEDSGVKTVQIFENSAKYTASLLPEKEYTCLFWADNAENASDPTDLTQVTYTANTAAYAGKITGKPSTTNQTVTLEPVTTKVTIEYTGGDSNPISVTYPYATTYNVKEQTATSPDTETVEFNQENAAAAQLSAAPRLVQALGRLSRAGDSESNCTFYTLLPSDEHDRDVTIEHENLVYTTKLTADISGASTPVKIDLSDKKTGDWQATAAYAQDMFEKLFIEENGTPKGTPAGGSYYRLLLTPGQEYMLNDVVAAIFYKEVTLDLSKNGLIFEENLNTGGDSFAFEVHNDLDPKRINITIRGDENYGSIKYVIICSSDILMYPYDDFSEIYELLDN